MASNTSQLLGKLITFVLLVASQVVLAEKPLDDIPGWQQTRWGMSIDQLIEIYGSDLTFESGAEGGRIVTLDDYQIFGQDFEVNFGWRDGGAALTTVRLRSNVNIPRRNIAENFEGSLETRYGAPEVLEHEEEDGPMALPGYHQDKRQIKLRWVLPSTIVVYDYFSLVFITPDADPGIVDIINITYQENQAARL